MQSLRLWVLVLVATAVPFALSFGTLRPCARIVTKTTSTRSSPFAEPQQQQDDVIFQTQPFASSHHRRRRRCLVVRHMGWGPDPIWSTCEVSSNEDACSSGSCVSVAISVPSETAGEYKIPGQYVQVRIAGDEASKPIFLAIASPPEGATPEEPEDDGMFATFEFLIKKTDSNDWITSAGPSTKVDVSQVLGNGFPMKENFDGFKYDFPTQNVLLFAAGSGIAPIRAAIESPLLSLGTSSGGRTARLYYGVRSPDDMPYTERFAQWEQMGVEVVPVVSDPDADWMGRTGYVQNALEEDGVPIPRNCGALLCGMKGMADSVRELLVKAGMFDGRILTNF